MEKKSGICPGGLFYIFVPWEKFLEATYLFFTE